MHTRLERMLACILLMGVFLVCVSPAADLDDCSLCYDQVASAISWLVGALLLLGGCFMGAPSSNRLRLAFVPDGTLFYPLDSARIDLIGNRRI